MLTLLSPAKSLGVSPVPAGLPLTTPRFTADIEILMKRCKTLSAADLAKLMKLSPPLAELNRQRFQKMRLPLTPENARPCVLTFEGDVYQKLDAASLSKRDLKWAQSRMRILSGLYGLLRPLDLIQPYRLEMGSRLETPRGRNLYEFWGDKLVDAINEEHARRRFSAVLNLASTEYFKAVPVKRLAAPLVTAVFQEIRDGEPKVIGFSAKRARGMLARFIVLGRIDDPEGLKDFSQEGYRYRSKPSTPERLVFARRQR
jgi:uncharacterized protein